MLPKIFLKYTVDYSILLTFNRQVYLSCSVHTNQSLFILFHITLSLVTSTLEFSELQCFDFIYEQGPGILVFLSLAYLN